MSLGAGLGAVCVCAGGRSGVGAQARAVRTLAGRGVARR